MPVEFAPRAFIPPPVILVAFFIIMALAVFGATTWAQEKAIIAAQADAADTYIPDDEEAPVTDAEVLPTAG